MPSQLAVCQQAFFKSQNSDTAPSRAWQNRPARYGSHSGTKQEKQTLRTCWGLLSGSLVWLVGTGVTEGACSSILLRRRIPLLNRWRPPAGGAAVGSICPVSWFLLRSCTTVYSYSESYSYSYSLWHGKAAKPAGEPEAHGKTGTTT
jgi:hypothetical protein